MKAPGEKKVRQVRGSLKVSNHPRGGEPFKVAVGAYFTRRSPGHIWIGLTRDYCEVTLHFQTPAEVRAVLADIAGQLATAEAMAEAERDQRERLCARPGCGHCWDDHSVVSEPRRCYVADCRCEGFVEVPSPPLPEVAAADGAPAAAEGAPAEEGRGASGPDGGGL